MSFKLFGMFGSCHFLNSPMVAVWFQLVIGENKKAIPTSVSLKNDDAIHNLRDAVKNKWRKLLSKVDAEALKVSPPGTKVPVLDRNIRYGSESVVSTCLQTKKSGTFIVVAPAPLPPAVPLEGKDLESLTMEMATPKLEYARMSVEKREKRESRPAVGKLMSSIVYDRYILNAASKFSPTHTKQLWKLSNHFKWRCRRRSWKMRECWRKISKRNEQVNGHVGVSQCFQSCRFLNLSVKIGLTNPIWLRSRDIHRSERNN